MVAVEGFVELGLELVVGLVHQVGKDGVDLFHAVLPLFGVEAGIHKLQVHQLEGRFQILHGAAAGNPVLQGIHKRIYAQVLAGEHLAHGGAGEGGDAGVVLEEHHQVVVKTGQVFGGYQAQTALLGEGEENLVFLQVGGIDDDLDTVFENPFGCAVEGGSALVNRAALELGWIQEGFRDILTFGGGDVGGFNLGHHGQQLLGSGGGDAFLLGAAVDDDPVLVSQELGRGLADNGGIDLAEKGFYNLLLRFRLHNGLLVKEVGEDGTDKFRVLARRGAVHAGFHHGDVVVLGAFEFGLGDAVFLEADQLRVKVAEAAQDIVLAQGNLTHLGLDVLINEISDVEAGAQVRRRGLGGDVLETLAHNHGEDTFNQILHLADGGGVGNLRHGFAVPDQFDGGGRGFRIRDDAYAGFLVAGNLLDGLGEGVFLEGNDAEELLDLGLGAVYIHVTHHHDGLVAGVIPSVIEVVEAFVLEGLQMLLRADKGTLGLLAVGTEVEGEAALHRTPLGVAALAALLDDDAALRINFLGLVKHEVGVVAQDHQAAVHHAFPFHGNVVEHVLRLLETGGGIDVAAEFRADGTEVVEDALLGEVFGPVEAHVLQEVGQAVLGRLDFLDGAYVGGQVEFRPAFGQLVVTDVITESVFQFAHPDLVGVGQFGHLGEIGFHLLTGGLLRQGQDGRQGKGSDRKKSFLHICV